MQDDLFEGLRNFGLSSYEIKVYKVLLLRGPQNSTEVVKNSGIPQPRVYDIFNNLQRRGLVETSKTGKKIIYRALPVQQGLGHHVKEMSSYLEELEKYVKKEMISSITKNPNIWLIDDQERIISRIKQMIGEARNEIILSLKKDQLERVIRSLNAAAKNGITVALVIFPDSPDEIVSFLDDSIVVKKREGIASEVVIVDREKGVINVDNGIEASYGLYFEEDEIIHILNYYFYHTIWWPSVYVNEFSRALRRRVTTAWLTCEAISSYSNKGMTVKGEFLVMMGEESKKIQGTIQRISVIPGMMHTFYVKTRTGELSVGGKTARVEDARLLNGTLSAK